MGNIPVLFEDKWLLIVDKPAGLLTVPTPRNEKRTLTSILNQEYRSPESPRIYPCHRLDRDTSGAIIYARGEEARDRMMDLFRSRKVHKTYVAVVHGSLSGHGRISIPIEGSPALTKYHVVETRGLFSVVRVFPETGRTNQIRIHFKQIDHPLVGETKFAFRKDYALKAKRAMLHALQLEFNHPVTARFIKVEAGLPDDMRAFLGARAKEH
jgi:RluA family pseudouridine synthase